MSIPVAAEVLDPVAQVEDEATRGPRARLGVVGWVSLAVVAVALLLAVLGPYVRPFDPNASDLAFANVGPFENHLLGFDGQGRDLLSRLMVGARTTVFGAASVAVAAVLLGTAVALVSAWFGGVVDNVISSVLDVVFAFPGILLAIVAAAVFGAGLTSAGIALTIAYAPYVARVLRSAALRERAMTYVAALEVQGFGAWRLCLRHLLPNISGLVVAQGTILFGFAMVDLAAVSFLGLGVQSPQADWGLMVAEGKTGVLQGYPLEAFSAVLCIVAVVSAVSFLGERLEAGATGERR